MHILSRLTRWIAAQIEWWRQARADRLAAHSSASRWFEERGDLWAAAQEADKAGEHARAAYLYLRDMDRDQQWESDQPGAV